MPTFVPVENMNFGSKNATIYNITLTASYPEGGYGIEPNDVGLQAINGIVVLNNVTAGGGTAAYLFTYDVENDALQCWRPAVGLPWLEEVPAGASLCWCTLRCLCIGD